MEEADETEYWLEIIKEVDLSKEISNLNSLLKEANEITKIMSKAKSSTSNKSIQSITQSFNNSIIL